MQEYRDIIHNYRPNCSQGSEFSYLYDAPDPLLYRDDETFCVKSRVAAWLDSVAEHTDSGPLQDVEIGDEVLTEVWREVRPGSAATIWSLIDTAYFIRQTSSVQVYYLGNSTLLHPFLALASLQYRIMFYLNLIIVQIVNQSKANHPLGFDAMVSLQALLSMYCAWRPRGGEVWYRLGR